MANLDQIIEGTGVSKTDLKRIDAEPGLEFLVKQLLILQQNLDNSGRSDYVKTQSNLLKKALGVLSEAKVKGGLDNEDKKLLQDIVEEDAKTAKLGHLVSKIPPNSIAKVLKETMNTNSLDTAFTKVQSMVEVSIIKEAVGKLMNPLKTEDMKKAFAEPVKGTSAPVQPSGGKQSWYQSLKSYFGISSTVSPIENKMVPSAMYTPKSQTSGQDSSRVESNNQIEYKRITPETEKMIRESEALKGDRALQDSMIQAIERKSNLYGVDPNVQAAIIKHESDFNKDAQHPGGGIGVGALQESTGRGVGYTKEELLTLEGNIGASAAKIAAGMKRGITGYKQLAQYYNGTWNQPAPTDPAKLKEWNQRLAYAERVDATVKSNTGVTNDRPQVPEITPGTPAPPEPTAPGVEKPYYASETFPADLLKFSNVDVPGSGPGKGSGSGPGGDTVPWYKEEMHQQKKEQPSQINSSSQTTVINTVTGNNVQQVLNQ